MVSQISLDLSLLEPIVEEYAPQGRAGLLPTLHAAQRLYTYLPEPVLTAIGQGLRVPLADIYGVVDFYTMFYREPVGERIIRVCTDPACEIAGAEDVLIAACKKAGTHPGEISADGSVTVERMTCLGLCDQAPAALVDERAFSHITGDQIDDLFMMNASPSQLRVTGEPRILTRHIGELDPLDLDAHRSAGAFTALKKALKEISPDAVIEEVKVSNLVGRGGAAFPTGLKWQFTRGAEGSPKYVVCNADESEPGTFKDRVLMEGDPYRILEGIMLCGYAVGSEKGYIFVRGEYPESSQALQSAIDNLHEVNLLGDGILGSDFNFEIEIRRGAGAYICGEETALFEAIEGKRGFPRLKPPFPTTNGLFNQPTCVNNVETLAAIPDIVNNGGAWFADLGTEKSSGVKLFCLSGHVNNPGLIEAPFGLTIRDLIEQHGGGFDGDVQAVLMGGAAGGFLTPDQLDTPLTFEDLQPLGAPIGSGVIMVFNTTVDLRMVLRRLAQFFAHESCGKCYPCQLGTQRQMEILDRAAEGKSQPGDLIRLQDIGWTMTDASICGLGQTAASAVLSALDHWSELVDEG